MKAMARHCACGARLSRYNSDLDCGACERDSRLKPLTSQAPPPAPPADPQQTAARPASPPPEADRAGLQPEEASTWLEPFHTTHARRRKPTAEPIGWRRAPHNDPDGRLLAKTCGCADEVWELWSVGGLRTIRRLGEGRAYETPPMRSVIATKLWQRLLAGDAR